MIHYKLFSFEEASVAVQKQDIWFTAAEGKLQPALMFVQKERELEGTTWSAWTWCDLNMRPSAQESDALPLRHKVSLWC